MDNVKTRRRTRARELAMQMLYQLDLRGEDAFGYFDEFLREHDADADMRSFARELVKGTWAQTAELDKLIAPIARNWEIDRMAVTDRNIIRMAAYELLHIADIPPKVSINEAIDLAKKYSAADSGAFVNGILDKIREEHVPDK